MCPRKMMNGLLKLREENYIGKKEVINQENVNLRNAIKQVKEKQHIIYNHKTFDKYFIF